MQTVTQTHTVTETHENTIDWIRICASAVVVKLTTTVNSRAAEYTYHIVDGTRWEQKLAFAIRTKRPIEKLLSELKGIKKCGNHHYFMIVSTMEMVQSTDPDCFLKMCSHAEGMLKKQKKGSELTHAQAVFDAANENRFDEIFFVSSWDHTVYDSDHKIIPTWQSIDMIQDDNYDLRALVTAFRKYDNVTFDETTNAHFDGFPEIFTIPYYNADVGLREYEVNMRWLPSQKQMETIMAAKYYRPSVASDLTKLEILDFEPFKYSAEEIDRKFEKFAANNIVDD